MAIRITFTKEIFEEWMKEAYTQNKDTLRKFFRKLDTENQHNEQSRIYATVAKMLSVFLAQHKDPLYGKEFQYKDAVKISANLSKMLLFPEHEIGVQINSLDYMLYPGNEHYFKGIPKDYFEKLQTKAKIIIEHDRKLDPRKLTDEQIKHLNGIINGEAPYGYHIYDPVQMQSDMIQKIDPSNNLKK